MSTEQTTPPPASATLAGDRGTAESGEAGSIEATAAEPTDFQPTADTGADSGAAADTDARADADLVDHELAAGPTDSAGTGPIVDAAGERSAGVLGGRPAAEAGNRPGADNAGAEPARQPAGSSWQAEAAGRLVAMSFPGARRIAGWLFWVIFPLLCIAAIHTSVSNVVHHLGNKPTGIRGTFVVQPRSCSQGFCSFGGLFTSDDHTIKSLPLLGDPRWHTADVLRVTYDPRSVEVTALPGHWDPTPSVMAAIGALTYLVLLGYFVREQRRAGRSWRRLASGG